MPTTTTITSNYSGSAAGELIGQAYKNTPTISGGLVTFVPNVKHKLSLKQIQFSDGRRDFTCGFVPAGTITLSEKELTPKVIKDDFQVCLEDFSQHWDGEETILEAIELEKLAETTDALENQMWVGDSSASGQIGGFVAEFEADVTVVDVTGPAVTKANVMAQMEKVFAAIPANVSGKNDVKFVVSSSVAGVYRMALISTGVSNGLGAGGAAFVYGQYDLTEVPSLPAGVMAVYSAKNLVVGHRGKDAQNSIVLDGSRSDLTGNIDGAITYSGDTGFYKGSEIVYRKNS